MSECITEFAFEFFRFPLSIVIVFDFPVLNLNRNTIKKISNDLYVSHTLSQKCKIWSRLKHYIPRLPQIVVSLIDTKILTEILYRNYVINEAMLM